MRSTVVSDDIITARGTSRHFLFLFQNIFRKIKGKKELENEKRYLPTQKKRSGRRPMYVRRLSPSNFETIEKRETNWCEVPVRNVPVGPIGTPMLLYREAGSWP
jgi:hypothetical protein